MWINMRIKQNTVIYKLFIVVLIVLISLSLSGCYQLMNVFADKDGLLIMSEDERIVDLDCIGHLSAIVSDRGNCYVNGEGLHGNRYYGLNEESRSKYNRFYNTYVGIYDGGNAVSIELSADGGCIITDKQEVYLFLNKNFSSDTLQPDNSDVSFQTPKLFCTGYVDAKLGNDERLYLLKENGDFGYVTVSEAEDYHNLSHNIMKFQLTQLNNEDDPILYLLNKDNELFSINYKGESASTNISNMNDVVDFDCLSCFNNYHAFSVLKDNGDAYAYWGLIYHPDNDSDSNATFELAGTGIDSVESYCLGTAMLDKQGDVHLFGSDSSSRTPEDYQLIFSGETVFHNIESMYGSSENLFIIRKSGNLEQYGHQPDNTYKSITP